MRLNIVGNQPVPVTATELRHRATEQEDQQYCVNVLALPSEAAASMQPVPSNVPFGGDTNSPQL